MIFDVPLLLLLCFGDHFGRHVGYLRWGQFLFFWSILKIAENCFGPSEKESYVTSGLEVKEVVAPPVIYVLLLP